MSALNPTFLGQPVPEIPYVTRGLYKLHQSMGRLFSPLPDYEKPLWTIAKRVAVAFSSIFVYPPLCLLALSGLLMRTIRLAVLPSIEIETIFMETLSDIKDEIGKLDIACPYWYSLDTNMHGISCSESYDLDLSLLVEDGSRPQDSLALQEKFRDRFNNKKTDHYKLSMKYVIVYKKDSNYHALVYEKTSVSRKKAAEKMYLQCGSEEEMREVLSMTIKKQWTLKPK